MAELVHEVWIDHNEDGQPLEACILAGPEGDEARAFLSAGAYLTHRFVAGSIFEAMAIYNHFLGRQPHTTDFASDYEPYPDDWQRQQSAGRVGCS